jgi:hypothetical protein
LFAFLLSTVVAARQTVDADSPVKSTGNEENHEAQEGAGGK